MKKLKSFKLSLVLCFGLLIMSTIPASAYYYENVKASWYGYSLVGIEVVKVTLHASGYSGGAGPGSVIDNWLTVDKCWYPNIVSDKDTWEPLHPTGQYAKGSFRVSWSVIGGYATVGTSGTTHTISILF